MDLSPGQPPRCPRSHPRRYLWITDWLNEKVLPHYRIIHPHPYRIESDWFPVEIPEDHSNHQSQNRRMHYEQIHLIHERVPSHRVIHPHPSPHPMGYFRVEKKQEPIQEEPQPVGLKPIVLPRAAPQPKRIENSRILPAHHR